MKHQLHMEQERRMMQDLNFHFPLQDQMLLLLRGDVPQDEEENRKCVERMFEGPQQLRLRAHTSVHSSTPA